MSAIRYALFQIGALAVAIAAFFLLKDHAREVALGLGALALVLPIFWLLVSALRPAMPDRKCPKCGKEALRLVKPGEKIGARCPECGFEDRELYVPFLIDVDDDL